MACKATVFALKAVEKQVTAVKTEVFSLKDPKSKAPAKRSASLSQETRPKEKSSLHKIPHPCAPYLSKTKRAAFVLTENLNLRAL